MLLFYLAPQLLRVWACGKSHSRQWGGGVRGKKEQGRDLLCDSPSLTQSSSIGTSGMRVCNNQLLSDC